MLSIFCDAQKQNNSKGFAFVFLLPPIEYLIEIKSKSANSSAKSGWMATVQSSAQGVCIVEMHRASQSGRP
jgi:hypothetical protein